MATQHGTITKWKDDKGFGFITPRDGGREVFFHISDVSRRRTRPSEHMTVTYTLTYDQQQRPRAANVSLAQTDTSTFMPITFLIVALFFAALALLVLFIALPVWVVVGYALVSVFTFYLYGVDKESAQQAAQRVPEAALHFFELVGGWPGALVAQSHFRHKTKKTSYQLTFWFMVTCNLGALAAYCAALWVN